MNDDTDSFRHVDVGQPIDGLDEEYEGVLAEYLHYIAQMLLGPPGRMISASDVWFEKRHPDHFALFNANVCVAPPRKIWFGDLDLTEDEPRLAVLARALDTKVYFLAERDGRFGGRDEQPLLERALLTIAPDGSVEHAPHLRRAGDGRLRPAKGRAAAAADGIRPPGSLHSSAQQQAQSAKVEETAQPTVKTESPAKGQNPPP